MTMITAAAGTTSRVTATAGPVPVRTVVRAAGLVDVPAVVRLITQPRDRARDQAHGPAGGPSRGPVQGPVHDVARSQARSRGRDGSAPDREQAQRALRLLLAHHALEEGQVWVAERADGTLLAAGVWLPPGTGTDPPGGPELKSLFSRELTACPPEHPALATVLDAGRAGESYWTLVAVCAPDDTEAWDRAVVADLLAPGLRAVDAQGAGAVAVTMSARHGYRLRPLGFRGPREVRVAPDASVWLTTRYATRAAVA